jgi:hypothetical protein
MAGTTIKEIQELAGHKTITMSARYNHHLSPELRLPSLQHRHDPSQVTKAAKAVIDRIATTASAETNGSKS